MSKQKADRGECGRSDGPPNLPPPEESADSGSAILGRLAHDLRGPLSPLQTAAYLLRREGLSQQRHSELLDIIDRQASRLGNMLQEMSDWMRACKGSLVSGRELVNVPMLVELAFARLAAAGGSIEVPEDLDDVEVLGDAQHLVQMLGSLLAFMQRRAGGAGVGVVASLVGDRLHIIIERRDEGAASSPGAALEQLIENSFTSPEEVPFDEGLGLRLLIAHAVVRAHGGRLSGQTAPTGHEQLRVELPLR